MIHLPRILNLSELSTFRIKGVWGPKHLPGSLIIKAHKCYLVINKVENVPDIKKAFFFDKNNLLSEINGHGIIIERNKLPRPVHIKLLNLSKIDFVDTNISWAGSSISLIYKPEIIMLSNKPLLESLKDMSMNNNELYVSNFSNFISELYFSPETDIELNKVKPHFKKDFNKKYLNNNKIMFTTYVNSNCKYSICEHRQPVYLNNLDTDFIGYKLIFYLHVDMNNIKFKQMSSLQIKYVKWFSLLSGNQEFNYKSIIFNDTVPINIMAFNKAFSNVKNNDFEYFSDYGVNNRPLLPNLLGSFKYWLNYFNSLEPVFDDININGFGTLRQQLQNICVSFEMIYDNFVKNIEDNKKVTGDTEDKISRTLRSMKKIPINNDIEDVLSVIFDLLHTKVFINDINELICNTDKDKYIDVLRDLLRKIMSLKDYLIKFINTVKNENSLEFLYYKNLPNLNHVNYNKEVIVKYLSKIRQKFNLNKCTSMGRLLISHQDMYSKNLSKCIYSLRNTLSHTQEKQIAGREFSNELLNNHFARDIVLLCLKFLVKVQLMKIIKISNSNIELLTRQAITKIQNNI